VQAQSTLKFVGKSFILVACLVLPHASHANENLLCNSLDVNKYLEKQHIQKLEITTKKTRKWAKNYFKILGSKDNNILPKYKKTFSATIKAEFSNGLECSFKAKIRVNGDWKDHIDDAPPLIASLDVKLLTGNINSVVKFKLFLPKTRNHDNEILVTTLLRKLGFISPKTYYIPTSFNDIEFTYLFQEKAQKELLEANLLREGPILVGDERFTWLDTDQYRLDHRLGLARLVNKNWANKGLISLDISQQAVSLLNRAYLDFMARSFVDNNAKSGKPPKGWYLNSDILANSSIFANEQNDSFYAMMLAMQATHGLRPHNRKFYYDPIYKHLLPIYYDGNSELLKTKYVPLDASFIPHGSSGAKISLAALAKIDKMELISELKLSGLNISASKMDKVFQTMEATLNEILKLPTENEKVDSRSYFSKYSDSDKLLVFSGNLPLEIVVCNFSLSNCNSEMHNLADYAQILNGRYINNQKQHYLYVAKNKEAYLAANFDVSDTEFNPQVMPIGDGSQLITYGSIDIDIDLKRQIIRLKPSDSIERALFVGGSLSNWNIIFESADVTTSASTQRFNENLITGCLTLLDIHLENLKITSSASFCEDSVNLIRATGTINSIKIIDAMSDALDVDFSTLSFGEINVSGAGNDCIDFSAGSYQIKKAILSDCADKAVSIGEQSFTTLTSTVISNANIGIAVKDSSTISIKQANFSEVTTCLSATKKKQEYWGSKLVIESSNCDKSNNIQQEGSLIETVQ